MRSSRFAISVAATLALVLPLTRATGQQAPSTVPQVITAGRGEVDIKPDRVRMEFGVETRAASAAPRPRTAGGSEPCWTHYSSLELVRIGSRRPIFR